MGEDGPFEAKILRTIRTYRLTRLVRVFRAQRLIRFMSALRTLVFSIMVTLKSLIWSLILLLLIIWMNAVFFTEYVTDLVVDAGELDKELVRYWGSLLGSMTTLLQA